VDKFTDRAKQSLLLRYKPLRQPIDCIALTVADDVAVDPEGDAHVAMAELISDHGDRRSTFD
jgi:hypothetical protein